jgi:hypothetical protein
VRGYLPYYAKHFFLKLNFPTTPAKIRVCTRLNVQFLHKQITTVCTLIDSDKMSVFCTLYEDVVLCILNDLTVSEHFCLRRVSKSGVLSDTLNHKLKNFNQKIWVDYKHDKGLATSLVKYCSNLTSLNYDQSVLYHILYFSSMFL